MPHPPLNILHRDQQIIALNKPSGLLSVPGIGPEAQDCLANRVAFEFPGARIVHRLDRDTSGVIVMALDADTHRELSRQFHDRETAKTYIAIAAGVMEKQGGEIDLPMRKDIDNPPWSIIDFVHGRNAVTRWRVIAQQPDRARLELNPITGRSHQIRLHLKVIDHPILGDDLYAPPEILALSDRLLLHAEALTITHPVTRERLRLHAPCPF
jgi:tRNA pseudouridine32 synthase/23S rRNA pseudouridine746 synthase